VRLVHQQDQVGQIGEMVEIAVAQHLLHSFDARLLAATHLGIDLGNIEDVDAHIMRKAPGLIVDDGARLVVVVAGDDQRRLLRKLGDALEDVFRRVACEVGDQLVVDRQVGRQHEEVVDAVRQMQVSDERAHQAGLAHAGGQREAQRRKLALKVRQRGELRLQRGENGRNIALVTQ